MCCVLLLCRAARQLDTLTKELTGPLSRYVKGFPHPSRLHPFERALLELTLGEARYCMAVERVDMLRKAMLEVQGTPEADVVWALLMGTGAAALTPRRLDAA